MPRASTTALTVVIAFALVSCGEAEESRSASPSGVSGSPSAAASPSAMAPSAMAPSSMAPSSAAGEEAGEPIEIEIQGGRVSPNGRQVEVAAGEEVTFAVTSDRAAELHVHSSPEQVLGVEKGRSTVTLVIERPGVVDVEEHESGLVVVRLEVR